MTYVLENELQGTLNLAILFYAKRFPEQRFAPNEVLLSTRLDDEAARERHYGRLEGLLIALGLDPSDPGIAVGLHEEIKTARVFLARCPASLEEPVSE